MAEEHIARTDRNDVVMKDARVDRRRRLLREDDRRRIETMPPNDRFGCFARLACWIALWRGSSGKGTSAVHEHLHAGAFGPRGKTGVLRRASVAELHRSGQRRVN